MYPLFETICVNNGICQNMEYHKERFLKACQSYFGRIPGYEFAENLLIPKDYQKGICKLKIQYNQIKQNFLFENYQPKRIESLKLVTDNAITYNLKYSNRNRIQYLFQLKKHCDDILIVKNGLITDTSFCNIVFFDGSQWITPSNPLLKGTMRQKLLDDKTIFEDSITIQDLDNFTHFKLINAMKDIVRANKIKIENIIF